MIDSNGKTANSSRSRQAENLINKFLTKNINEIHKNYFKCLSFNERNKKFYQENALPYELEDASGAELNAESSNSISSNLRATPDNVNFFVQRPKSKAMEKTSETKANNNDQTKIIYQLSKIHSCNKKRNYFNSSSFQTQTNHSNKKSINEYHEIEMKTLALVDFKEEKLLNEI